MSPSTQSMDADSEIDVDQVREPLPAPAPRFSTDRRDFGPLTQTDVAELLMLRIREGETSDVRRLLELGADPNAKDWAGRDALYRAISAGNDGTAQLLLDWGADPLYNFGSSDGAVVSSMLRRREIFDRFAQDERVVRACTADGRTLMHMAAVFGMPSDIIKVAARGLDLDAQDDQGASPLLHTQRHGGNCVRMRSQSVAFNVRILLALGAKPLERPPEVDLKRHTGSNVDAWRAMNDGPALNAARLRDANLVREIMLMRERSFDPDDLKQAKSWLTKNRRTGGAAEIATLFDGFLQSAMARRAIQSAAAMGLRQ